MFWKCASYSFDTRMPIIVGILNLTPDSFSDGGSYSNVDEACSAALAMVEQGAQIIDIGGESTRPGASVVSEEEELQRVIEVVKQLASQNICISIDTRHASVAQACVNAGASIINDVTGFCDSKMLDIAKKCDAGLIVMHCGNHFEAQRTTGKIPTNMAKVVDTKTTGTVNTTDDTDIVADVYNWLRNQTKMLESQGIARDRICVDPGPGFGKGARQTLEMVRNFHVFRHLGYPVMQALSRKSYIGHAYKIDDPMMRDEASAKEALMACELGATLIRTHNVQATTNILKDLRPYVLLGLGSNVALVSNKGEEREGKIANLNQAISQICALPDTTIIDVSSFYESQPAYYDDQDTFVNATVLLRTGIVPKELLGYLHAIENSLGRVREIKNGPRTCDIDILDYQLYVSDSSELVLPHPKICERDFVVKPLCEIVPGHILANGVGASSVPREKRIGWAKKIFSFNVEYFDEVSSTNDVVLDAIDNNKNEGYVACAFNQLNGYGRRNSRWDSPYGGLYFSMLLKPCEDVKESNLPNLMNVVAGTLAKILCNLIDKSYASSVAIKKPNDIVMRCMPEGSNVVGDYVSKLGGIIAQVHGDSVCVGVGINLFAPNTKPSFNHDPQLAQDRSNLAVYLSDYGFNDEYFDAKTIEYAMKHQDSKEAKQIITQVLQEFLDNFEKMYFDWLTKGPEGIDSEFSGYIPLFTLCE